ncbi:MAG: HAD family hydrolase [Nitrososphaerales archaeon]
MDKKLVAFDMDGTLINGRLVFVLGDRFGVSDVVKTIMSKRIAGHKKSEEIAKLWKGLKPDDIAEAIASVPLMKGASGVIRELKRRGHKVGIISDSYTLATGYMAKKLDMDFHLANILLVKDGLITGELRMLLGWDKIGCTCKISVCKRFHLEKVAKLLNIALDKTIAIGDTASDLCMIKTAGTGIAFNPKDEVLTTNADRVIKNLDLNKMLQYVDE